MHDAGGSALTRQAVYACAGGVLFLAVLFIDPDRYLRLTRPIYFGTLGVMIFVLAAGAATRGSRRWIDVGFFTFQPSEFGKVVFVLALAGFVVERSRSLASAAGAARDHRLRAGADRARVRAARHRHGARLRRGARGGALRRRRALVAPRRAADADGRGRARASSGCCRRSGVNVLRPYQTARLTGFTHPANDPRGATYNLTQSITAVGAGGLRGRGVQGATQTRLDYLPEHATDFAFASLSEEHGFFGASILLLLYLLVVWRALKIVASARDLYCAVVAGAIAFMFLFQVFVNSAMTMGIAPITGIPLPFVSVGGSSMITNFLALGILQAIHMRRVLRRRG